MPKPHPREFRDDVVAVARKGEASIAQIAKDFGISESCLRNWLHRAPFPHPPSTPARTTTGTKGRNSTHA